MKFVLFLILFLIAQLGCAQDAKDQLISTQMNGFIPSNSQTNMLFAYNSAEVLGTPFFYDEWKNGRIITNSGVFENTPLKYSVLTDEVYFKNPKGEMLVTYKNTVKEFSWLIGIDQTIVFRNVTFKEEDKTFNGFVQVIYDGKVKFYKQYRKSYKKAEKQQGYSTQTKDEYADSNRFLIGKTDGVVIEVSRKKKAIFKALGSHEEALKKFYDQNKLDLDKDTDLNKLLVYYDSL